MRHFVDYEGVHYTAIDARDMVAQLHADAFTKSRTDAAFMRAMAKRVEFTTGRPVRSDTPENFVTDLLAAGIIREKS